MKRSCVVPRCGNFVVYGEQYKGRCPKHSAEARAAHSKTYGTAWQRQAPSILARDGGICWRCGKPGADEVGHVVAVAHGGTSDPSNLHAEHKSCNRAAGGATRR